MSGSDEYTVRSESWLSGCDARLGASPRRFAAGLSRSYLYELISDRMIRTVSI